MILGFPTSMQMESHGIPMSDKALQRYHRNVPCAGNYVKVRGPYGTPLRVVQGPIRDATVLVKTPRGNWLHTRLELSRIDVVPPPADSK